MRKSVEEIRALMEEAVALVKDSVSPMALVEVKWPEKFNEYSSVMVSVDKYAWFRMCCGWDKLKFNGGVVPRGSDRLDYVLRLLRAELRIREARRLSELERDKADAARAAKIFSLGFKLMEDSAYQLDVELGALDGLVKAEVYSDDLGEKFDAEVKLKDLSPEKLRVLLAILKGFN